MEKKNVKVAILSMAPITVETSMMEKVEEYAEITPITVYEEETVKKIVENKDIVILLLNEETKEEIETYKKVVRLTKKLHTFAITFVSDQVSKEVQEELKHEVEALITVSQTREESVTDVLQAIQIFLQTIIVVGLCEVDIRYMKVILKKERQFHVTRQKGNVENVIASIASHDGIKKANSIIYHISLGEKIVYDHIDRMAKNIHKYALNDENMGCMMVPGETMGETEVILTLMVG